VAIRGYVRIFLLLVGLTALTVAAAQMRLGFGTALVIAALKASLVALFFMHLKHEGRLTWFVALFPLALLLVLILLLLPDFR
jgi:cytochrome c oxidase subunit 4